MNIVKEGPLQHGAYRDGTRVLKVCPVQELGTKSTINKLEIRKIRLRKEFNYEINIVKVFFK
jgi:hypothetical protein